MTTWFKTYGCTTRQGTTTTKLLWMHDDSDSEMVIVSLSLPVGVVWYSSSTDWFGDHSKYIHYVGVEIGWKHVLLSGLDIDPEVTRRLCCWNQNEQVLRHMATYM
jgi:hypothetical protein